MKSVILTFVMLLTIDAAAGAVPQNTKHGQTAEIVRNSIQDSILSDAICDMTFVLEANRLVTPSGESVMVASNTNFVMIEGDKAVIQVSPLTGPGINGVGGITVDGYISDVQFNTDRRGNLILTMNVKGAAASCRLMFTLGKGGGMARVRIDPNYSADDITLFGDLVPAELSTVHQGRTL